VGRQAHTPSIEELLEHGDWVWRLARSLVRDDNDADDIVQETWYAALRLPPRPDGSPAARFAWLSRVVRHAAARIARSKERRDYLEREGARLDEAPAADRLHERESSRRALVEEVLSLPRPYSEVLLLRYFDELTPREVAKRLGVNRATVRSQIARGLELLRSRLERRGDQSGHPWVMALLPVIPRPLSAGVALTGVMAVNSKLIGVVLSVALLLSASWYLVSIESARRGPVREIDQGGDLTSIPSDMNSIGHSGNDLVDPGAGGRTVPAVTEASESSTTSTIRGRVLDPASRPIADATVSVSYKPAADYNLLDLAYSSHDVDVGSVETAADGSFAIPVPQDWPLRVTARASGYSASVSEDVFSGADILYVLEQGASVVGQVTRKLDGSPVGGAVVGVFRRGRPGFLETRTSPDGRYVLRDVPPGASVVTISTDWLADPPWTDVDLPQGAQVIRDFALDEGVSVFGTVSDIRTGLPIANAEVGAGWVYDRSVRTGRDGTYEIRGLGGPSQYDVYARAEGYVDAKRDYGPQGMPTGRTQLDFSLSPGNVIIGRIVTPQAAPIAEAYVAAVSDGGPDGIESWKSARSQADGTFEIHSLSPQHQYGLFVRATGWANVAYALKSFSGSSPLNVGDVELQKAGSMSGSVVDEAGRALSDVTVALYGSNADAGRLSDQEHPQVPRNLAEREVTSDALGHFHFGEVARGEYTLRALHRSGHYSEPLQIVVDSVAHLDDLQLVLASGFRLFGRAASPLGDGLLDARVHLVREGNIEQAKDRYDFTRDGGSFEFLGLDDAPYTVIVQHQASDNDPDQSMLLLTGVRPSEVELSLVVPRAQQLHGVVLLPDGTPSPRAHVSALSGNVYLDSEVCDDKGRFALFVPEGTPCDLLAYTTSPSPNPRYPFKVNRDGPSAAVSAVTAHLQEIVLTLQAQ